MGAACRLLAKMSRLQHKQATPCSAGAPLENSLSTAARQKTPNLEQQPQPNCSELSHAQQPEQDEAGMRSAEGSPSDQPQSCMDAELQWDAAVLTVMVEGHADIDANEGGDSCS